MNVIKETCEDEEEFRAAVSIRGSNHASHRLLVMSNVCLDSYYLSNIILEEVKTTLFKYENYTLDDVLACITAELGGLKVRSIAFILSGTESEMHLAGIGDVVLSSKTLMNYQNIRDFFVCLSSTFLDAGSMESRLDFFDCPIKNDKEVLRISHLLNKLCHCAVGISNNLHGCSLKDTVLEHSRTLYSGELYFNMTKLRVILSSSLKCNAHNLLNYEIVRTVGKGAYGTAVLYQNKDDNSLIIVKKINIHDLTASERQLAINEVKVLSMLDHENIVSYYNSFEEDGVLMIEMEYADGGTLAQYLSETKTPIEEQKILVFFKQIVSAISHMHKHNILHRDLKTANIFLTNEGVVKVGDFGISKMLTTRQQGALTVVGTPYYISPEMCEGKLYNQKSDIWAVGCILYEMACQQKTFEGTNLPALVNKIVKGQFAPVRGNYSEGLKQLIQDLLQRDPDYRPTANEILNYKLPRLLKVYDDQSNYDYEDNEISTDFISEDPEVLAKSSLKLPIRSVLYRINLQQFDITLNPIPLPPHAKIKEVALSSTHMIVLTSEQLVYTWGEGVRGQLGHGKLEKWRKKPLCVDALKGKNITRIGAGEGFSVFVSDNGLVSTCGTSLHGCLGHGDLNVCIKPKLVEKLLSIDATAVSCGPQHVVVLGSEGDAYAWGCGLHGRLGTGTENDCRVPTAVQFPNDVRTIRVHCGYDGTMFVTTTGRLLSCGHNQFNKLGLNEPKGFLSQMKQFISKTEVEKQLIPLKLNWLHHHVVSVSMGVTHTAVLVEPGKVITFGCNKYGQLGRGNVKSHTTPTFVKAMNDQTITMVQCGDTFTVVGTTENVVYFWGSQQVLYPVCEFVKLPKADPKNKLSDPEGASEISETSVSDVIKIGESNSPLMKEIERIGPDSPIIQVKSPDCQLSLGHRSLGTVGRQRSGTSSSQDNEKDNCSEGFDAQDIVLYPHEILALYASPAQISKDEIVKLMNLYCFGMQLYLAVDTTVPLPQHYSHKLKPKDNAEGKLTNAKRLQSQSCEDQNEDSLANVPEWLRKEYEYAIALSMPPKENNSNIQKVPKSQKVTQNILFPEPLNKENTEAKLIERLQQVTKEKEENEEKLKRMEENLARMNNNREKDLEEEIKRLKEQLHLQICLQNEAIGKNKNKTRGLKVNMKRPFIHDTKGKAKPKLCSKICIIQ